MRSNSIGKNQVHDSENSLVGQKQQGYSQLGYSGGQRDTLPHQGDG